MKLKIAVIVASIRNERNADAIIAWLKTETEQYKGNLEFSFIDLKQREIPHFIAAKVPAQRAYEDAFTRAWSAEIAGYDGFVVVTPEYNHSYPAVIKDAFDHLFHEWVYKPIAFVGYGTDGGVRAIEHLRLMSIQLAMVPIRRQITLPVWETVNNGSFTHTEQFHGAVQAQLEQLAWWAETLKTATASNAPIL